MAKSFAIIWLIRPDGGEAECLARSKSAVSGFKWSPEGDRIVFMTVDALSKDEEKKKKDKDDARMIGQDARMTHLWAIDLNERKAQRLTRGRFHITGFDCSPNGRQLVYAYARTSISDEARPINLAIIASGGGRRKVIVQRPGIDRSPRWSPDGKTIAFVSDGGVDDRQAESKLWVVPARGGESRCLLPAEDRFGGIGAWSPDSRFIYYGAQRGVRFHVRRVSALLLPNPRGSSGYGEVFRRANYQDWGGGDYNDIMAGVDALIGRGTARPDRLGIMGWSHGGYMMAWVVSQTTRFKAVSIGAGITNLYSMQRNLDWFDKWVKGKK